MSATSVNNPTVPAESKSAKKKKAKAEAAPPSTNGDTSASPSVKEATTNGTDATFESPYMKELYKSIRNVNKKINASQKVDAIVAENPGKTLDELVAARKINNDQKAQVLKKPGLLAQLASLEEQVSQYKKFDQEYQNRLNAEKDLLRTQHKEELEKLRETVEAEAKAEALKQSKERLLLFSKFLRAAAANRENSEKGSDENKAFEGALLQVYGGDATAVAAAEKLIDGVEEGVIAIDGTVLEYTYAQLKEASLRYAPLAPEDTWVEEPPAEPVKEETVHPIVTDPTEANAGLTEIDNPVEPTNGVPDTINSPVAPEQTSIDAGAGNEAAESQWDTKLSASVDSGAEGWIEVPRDPAETETGTVGVPAAQNSTESWADDHPTDPSPAEAVATPVTNGNDGFHEVHHGRGGRGRGHFQGERRGSQRGRGGFRGGEGGYRGGRGGFRGDRGGEGGHRGRGRGGFRGGRGRDTPQ